MHKISITFIIFFSFITISGALYSMTLAESSDGGLTAIAEKADDGSGYYIHLKIDWDKIKNRASFIEVALNYYVDDELKQKIREVSKPVTSIYRWEWIPGKTISNPSIKYRIIY